MQSGHLATRCTESWEMYWRVTVMKAKSDWLDCEPLRMQTATSCPCIFLNFRDQTITQPEMCLEPPLSRTIPRNNKQHSWIIDNNHGDIWCSHTSPQQILSSETILFLNKLLLRICQSSSFCCPVPWKPSAHWSAQSCSRVYTGQRWQGLQRKRPCKEAARWQLVSN